MNKLKDVLDHLEIGDRINDDYQKIWEGAETLDRDFFSFRLFLDRNNALKASMAVSDKFNYAMADRVESWLFEDTVNYVANTLERKLVGIGNVRHLLMIKSNEVGKAVLELRITRQSDKAWELNLRRSVYKNRERLSNTAVYATKITP